MLKLLDKPQEKNTYKALKFLSESSSEVYFLLRETMIRASQDCKTAFAAFDKPSKKFVIGINQNWLNTFDTYNLAAVIEHELYHIILSHVLIFKNYEDLHLANLAMDSIINDLGNTWQNRAKLNSDLLNSVFFDVIFEDLVKHEILTEHHGKTSQNTTSKEVYELLRKLKEKNQSSTDDLIPTDDHSKHDLTGSKDDSLSPLHSEEAQEIIKEFLQAENKDGEKLRSGIGAACADLTFYLKGYYKARSIREFKKSINNFYSCSKNFNKKNTMKKPSRRFNNPIGKTRIKKCKIKLCIDSSGSQLNDECIEKINIAICNALDLGFDVDLTSGDVKKQFEKKNITKNFDFSECLKGGGGTELKFFFEDNSGEIKEEAVTYVIVTDGYFDSKDIPDKISKKKILMLSTSHLDNIHGFKTILIF